MKNLANIWAMCVVYFAPLLVGIILAKQFKSKVKTYNWPPDVKRWLIGKDPDNGYDWGQEEKGVKENKMIG